MANGALGETYQIHQLRLPAPRVYSAEACAYLVSAGAQHLLVDTGPDSDDAYGALVRQLRERGVQPRELSTVVVTHAHPDHYGGAARLRGRGVRVLAHRTEAALFARREDRQRYRSELAAWLVRSGVPPGDANEWAEEKSTIYRNGLFVPDGLLSGGETLLVGPVRLIVAWTPGHTPGHIVLLEARRKVAIVGDHVLPAVAPNIGADGDDAFDAAFLYERSLKLMARKTSTIAFPGHGEPFVLGPRAKELLGHHRKRRRRIVDTISAGVDTSYLIARQIWPDASWNDFSTLMRCNAIRAIAAQVMELE